MKKLVLLIGAVLMTATIWAQAPDKMSYQAVIRDNRGSLITQKEVTVQISVLKGNKEGEAVYVENQRATTNANGLLTLEIGSGRASQGSFKAIDWASGPYFIKTATDVKGGDDYSIVGVSELLSVPYALHARTAENGFSGNYNDLVNKPLYLSQFINDTGYISNLGTNIVTNRPLAGIPSQTWSLFGNSNSDANYDKLGTTDYQDLVVVTNNLDRFRILANGDINIKNSLAVGKDLDVNRNVTLNILGGQTINNGPFTVANGSASHLTGSLDVDQTLNVDGTTDLNSSLSVNNAAATHLTGSLTTDGITNLNSALNVNNGAASHLTGDLDVDGKLNVDGVTDLNSAFTVHNAAASNMSGTLKVDQSLTVDGKTYHNNQVTINASLSGGQNTSAAYPLFVTGSDQGIMVKLSADTPNNDNNFMTFLSGNNVARGRIEGQTLDELHLSFDFIFETTFFALDEALTIAQCAAAGLSVPPDVAETLVNGIEGVALATHYATWEINGDNEVGLAFESGGADYAEWLKKGSLEETFSPGDIVAVTGGTISKRFKSTDKCKFMVVSTNPIVVGNMPGAEGESNYARIAFMGQVPVKVRGSVHVGDYILVSDLQDGFGIAVSPAKMKIEDYNRIAGIAWSEGKGTNGFNMVNMAVGVNSNDLADKLQQQQQELTAVKQQMNVLMEYLKAKDPSFAMNAFEVNNQAAAQEVTPTVAVPESLSTSTASQLDFVEHTLKSNPAMLQQVMTTAKAYLDKKGVDYNRFEQTRRMITDPTYMFEVMREFKH